MAFRTRQSNKLSRSDDPDQNAPPPSEPASPEPPQSDPGPPPRPGQADGSVAGEQPDQALSTDQPAAPPATAGGTGSENPEVPVAADPESSDATSESTADLERKWLEAQAHILDDPREAVHRTDQVVGEVMEHLSRAVTEHRHAITSSWAEDDRLSTDELREVMKRYRDIFRHLLGAMDLPAAPEPPADRSSSDGREDGGPELAPADADAVAAAEDGPGLPPTPDAPAPVDPPR